MLARSLLVLASLLLPGALHAEGTPAEKTGFASRLTIYLANGPPDACGPGCDRAQSNTGVPLPPCREITLSPDDKADITEFDIDLSA
ncbi:hypothetical protein C7G41_24850 [Bradyrhizobium sp. MOS002]|jgi:hypothetical protein|nr:hypothetical protein C7G41_24850 [Bradyrhizobium sp. MOS002]